MNDNQNGRNEKDFFHARLREQLVRAEKYAEGCSAFLSPAERADAERYVSFCGSGVGDVYFFFYGGYDGAERTRLFSFPDCYAPEEKEMNAAALREHFPELLSEGVAAIRIQGSGYRRLSHRDILGSVLALGIERDALGDIVFLDDFTAILFCDRTIAEFLKSEWKRVANDAVKITDFDIPGDFEAKHDFLPIRDTVASCRLDAVVSALCGVSREKGAEMVRSGLVEVDYLPESKTDKAVADGSGISVRGYGKYIVRSVSEETKKGRYRLVADKYK